MADNEINRLPPTMRKNYRYIRFKICSEEEVELGECVDSLWDSLLSYMGTRDTGEADLWIVGNAFDREKQRGIIRVSREFVDDVKASMVLTEEMGGKEVTLKTEQVSGSIDKLKDS